MYDDAITRGFSSIEDSIPERFTVSAAELNRITGGSHSCVFIITTITGKILYVSPPINKHVNKEAAEFIGKSMDAFIPRYNFLKLKLDTDGIDEFALVTPVLFNQVGTPDQEIVFMINKRYDSSKNLIQYGHTLLF